MKSINPVFFVLFSISSFGQLSNSDSSNGDKVPLLTHRPGGVFESKIDSIAVKSKCYFIAGSSGGFSGKTVQYYFLNDGNIYRSENLTKKDSLIKKLSKKETKTVFKKLKALQLEKINLDHPGNMTYFIEEHIEGKVSSIKWGGKSAEVPPEVGAFYKYITDLVN